MGASYKVFRNDSRPFFIIAKDYSVIKNKPCHLQNINFDNIVIINTRNSPVRVDRLFVDVYWGETLIQSSLVPHSDLGRTANCSYDNDCFHIPSNEGIGISQFFVSFYFAHIADRFEVRIDGDCPSSVSFGLVNYSQKTELSAPFKGGWVQVGNYHDIWSHRMLQNSEFGNDYIQVDAQLRPYAEDLYQTTEHHCYQAPIFSPASGKVVSICNEMPDNLNPYSLIELESVGQKYSEHFPNVGGGNFIVIDHLNGEFSFLGHLAKDSILPKIGDMVVKGERIAFAGNSGSSCISPHLHYQLMSSSDLNEAYTYPYQFENCSCSVFSPQMFHQFKRRQEHIDFFKDVSLQLLSTIFN